MNNISISFQKTLNLKCMIVLTKELEIVIIKLSKMKNNYFKKYNKVKIIGSDEIDKNKKCIKIL